LLIDEVDVYFNDEFYGQCYKPTTPLEVPLLETIMKEIWKNRTYDK
jgi:hypothetical protein